MRYCSHCHSSYGSEERFCPLDGAPVVEDASSDDRYVGRTLGGRYLLRRRIGQGGMGVVYEADHVGLDKRVAIKFLLDKFASDREVLLRFHREARTASRIGHENIIDITDIGEEPDGKAYIVMELCAGQDLSQVMRRIGPMPVERAVHIIRQVCRGLAAAHAKGIVHRDMKPENVFLTQRDDRADRVKIMDFGISKVIDAHDSLVRLTQTGAVVGTPIYMAPEQAVGAHDVDARADVYAVGVMFFEMLCGRPPFTGKTYVSLVTQHLNEPPPAPRALRQDIPRGVEQAILRALAKKPSDRFESIKALEEALPVVAPPTPSMIDLGAAAQSRASAPAGTYAAPTAVRTRLFRGGLRSPLLIVAGAAVLAIGFVVAGWLSGRGRSPAAARAEPRPAVATRPASDAAPVRSEPLRANLEIDSKPQGADVYVDGEHRGQTPVSLQGMEPGAYTIRLERSGFAPLESQKRVRAGYNESFVAAMSTQASGRQSQVKPTAGQRQPAQAVPRADPAPTAAAVTPRSGEAALQTEPATANPAAEVDPDRKPNPFDGDRKRNPFVD